ncbi:MAG: small basic protein [Phycisphaerales bacterium]|nr:small basic protein [Phycisphaerales bacterium]
MSLDRSLKGKSTLERHRNVLKRSERITVLEDNEKWHEDSPAVFGLVKVAHRKASAGKKPAKAEAAEGATTAAPGAAAAPAGKAAAAPAAKAAAPAAKGKK